MSREELERKCIDILMGDMQHIGESEEILRETAAASDEDLINFLAEQED